MIFHIAALPRSGTAFLSTMFNMSPEIFCFHEAITHDKDPVGMMSDLEGSYQAVGDCSSALLFPKFNHVDARRIYIDRDIGDAKHAAENCALRRYNCDRAWEKLVAHAERWGAVHSPPVINFDQLFTIEALETIWELAVDGKIPFEKEKVKLLLQNNIQKQGLSYTPEVVRRAL